MNQYRRIVSYLYKYENGKKGDNTGFVRVDTKEEGVRLHLRINDLKMMDERRLKMYFYFHKENQLQLIFVDEFLCIRGNCEYKKMVFPDLSDRDFEKINGVIFLDEQGLFYGSCWDEREISEDLLPLGKVGTEEDVFEKKNDRKERLREQKDKLEENSSKQEVEKETCLPEEGNTRKANRPKKEIIREENMSEQQFSQEKNNLLSQYPQIELYHPEEAIQAVRIQIENISMLSMKDWKVADNAFLKQAYEMEPHLLLGKVRMPNEREIWVLGVPGVYDNREKYLAGIFGFTDYIPVENREFKTGGSGYWIRQIEDVE